MCAPATNHPPVLAFIPNPTLHALMTLRLTNSATDPDFPAQTLTYSLDPGAPAEASIGATSGVLLWTPPDSAVGPTLITARVTDNGSPSLSDTQAFTVNVLSRPTLTILSTSNHTPTLTWSSISGLTYQVQFKTNLNDAALPRSLPNVTATGATASATDSSATNAARLYRVVLVP